MNPQSILDEVQKCGGMLYLKHGRLFGRIEKGKKFPHSLQSQIKENKASLVTFLQNKKAQEGLRPSGASNENKHLVNDNTDRIAKKEGWFILSPGEAYEKVLHRKQYFKKVDTLDGEKRDVLTQSEHVLYLFKEPNGTWIACRASWNGNRNPTSEKEFAKGSFEKNLHAAKRYEAWYRSVK